MKTITIKENDKEISINYLFSINYESNLYIVYEENKEIYANKVVYENKSYHLEEITDDKVYDLIDEYLENKEEYYNE